MPAHEGVLFIPDADWRKLLVSLLRRRIFTLLRCRWTSPWLKRVALTTIQGKQWSRVHVVEHPLTEYLRYELVGYIESQAAGEEIRVADRGVHSGLAELGPDSWLFDAETPEAFGVVLHFDADGHLLSIDKVTDSRALQELERQRQVALDHSVSLAEYLAPYHGA